MHQLNVSKTLDKLIGLFRAVTKVNRCLAFHVEFNTVGVTKKKSHCFYFYPPASLRFANTFSKKIENLFANANRRQISN